MMTFRELSAGRSNGPAQSQLGRMRSAMLKTGKLDETTLIHFIGARC